MSLEAMVWALRDAPVPEGEPLALLVLIGLANHAAADGTAAWPSAATLAEYARCSVRTVRTKLGVLESAGLIRRGNQEIVSHLRGDRRPVVWDLAISGVRDLHPVHPHGVNDTTARGEQHSTHGVNAVAHKPSIEPSMNRGEAESLPAHPDRCSKHQAVENPPACWDCKTVRELAELRSAAETRRAADAAREERLAAIRATQAAIRACNICDAQGYTPAGRVCHHDPALYAAAGSMRRLAEEAVRGEGDR